MRLSVFVFFVLVVITMPSPVFADGPILEIVIEENITVGDNSNHSGESINEPVSVADSAVGGSNTITEAITTNDSVSDSSASVIESITVGDSTQSSAESIHEPVSVGGTETYDVSDPPTLTATTIPNDRKEAEMSDREKAKAKEESAQPEKERRTGNSSGESSGSCTSGSSHEGLALLGMLLVPVVLKNRKKIGL